MAWCDPELEFTKDVFFPGEEVTGRAWISTKKDMTARKIEITFCGETITAWMEKERESEVASTAGKRAQQVHVKISHEVWKAADEKNNFPAGDYEWNFSFELPKDCPASFEGLHGFIRYTVMINVDVPHWIDSRAKKAVTVSPVIDLNLISGANQPTRVQLENPVQACCGCIPMPFMKKGNVSFTLSSPTLGYVSGQTATVTCLVENQSTRTIESIIGSLHRMVIFREDLEGNTGGLFRIVKNRPDDSSNSRRQVVDYEKKEESCQVTSGSTKEVSFSFEIPPVVATIRNSKFICVEYFVRITAGVEGWSCSEARADMNIIVGNVPLGCVGAHAYTFREGDAAQRWSNDLEKEFAPLFPYFGTEKEGEEGKGADEISV